jgi:hypothetical protein
MDQGPFQGIEQGKQPLDIHDNVLPCTLKKMIWQVVRALPADSIGFLTV